MEKARITISKGRNNAFISPKGSVYQYFSVLSEKEFEGGVISYRIHKLWFSSHNNISLVYNYNGLWKKVDSTRVSEDKKYYYFTASVKHFGHFSIVGEKKSATTRSLHWSAFGIAVILFALLSILTIGQLFSDGEFNGIPRQHWLQDTTHTLDLTQFFNDPDNETLQFSGTPTEHFDIFIDRDGVVAFTPDQGWTGTERVVFTATDEERETVSSNTVYLNVYPSYIPVLWIVSIKYVLLVLLILALILAIVRFKNQLVKLEK